MIFEDLTLESIALTLDLTGGGADADNWSVAVTLALSL
jgi:hypothetical protein